MLHEIRRGSGVLSAPLPVRAHFFPFWHPLDDAYRIFLSRMPPGGRRGVTSFLGSVDAYAVYAAVTVAFEAEDPANAPILTAARAFRTKNPADPVDTLLRC